MNVTGPAAEPRRDEIDALAGAIMLEFGSATCGHCLAAQPLIAAAMQPHSHVRHIRIADGPGRRLGRSFSVKLWPTLIFLSNGKELSRLVRPQDAASIDKALAAIDVL